MVLVALDTWGCMNERIMPNFPEQHQDSVQTTSMYNRSISTQLRWSYLISSTLPLLLVGMLLIMLSFRAQQRAVYDEQISLATQASNNIAAYITGLEPQILSFGRRVLSNDTDDIPPERLQQTVQELFRTNWPDVHDLTVVNTDGQVLTHFSRDLILPGEMRDPNRDPLVQAALQQGRGGWSDITYTMDERAVFTIVLPLRTQQPSPIDQAGVSGAVRATVSAAPVQRFLRPVTDESQLVTYLINGQHEVMLSDSRREWQPPAGLDALFSTENASVLYRGGNDQQVIGARARVFPSNWWVIVEQPSSEAFATLRRSVVLLATLVAVVGVLALALGLFQAQKILRPLRALGAGAEAFGAGQLNHRIDVHRRDEMGQLAHTFNQMAAQLSLSLSEIERQNEHLRHGLMLARDIQMGLLPATPPWNQQALAVEARSIPAYEVGGDFYTYLALPNDRAAVAVGDISGKGIAAALLMALTSSAVESQARHITRPAEVFQMLNRLLSPRLRSNRMNAALVYAVFDLQAHTMTVANAGMIAPLLICGKTCATDQTDKTRNSVSVCEFVEIGGFPIGSMPDAAYQEVTITLQSGDTVLFVSDGVVEAMNASGEMFGFERLEALMTTIQEGYDTSLLVSLILQQVQEFIGPAEQHDDITVVAVRPTLLSHELRDAQADLHVDSAAATLSVHTL